MGLHSFRPQSKNLWSYYGRSGIRTPLPLTLATRYDEYHEQWGSQNAADKKFDAIRAAGGSLSGSDFSNAPADLHVFLAYVTAFASVQVF